MPDVNVWTNSLIGRDRELAALGSLLDEAVADGATLLLTGEPGVGKTALLAAAAEMAATAGFEVIRAGGVEYETDVSFAGLHQLVGPLSGDLRRLPRSSRVAMEVALGIGSGPAPERLAVLNASLALFRQAASRGPLLIVIDDLHWLDRASGAAVPRPTAWAPSSSAMKPRPGRSRGWAGSSWARGCTRRPRRGWPIWPGPSRRARSRGSRRPSVKHTAPEPDTIAGWRAVADGFLSDPCCAFHRNVEISSCYAWIHQRQPACFKWAAMAAIASHHIRLVLFPLRLDTDRTGFVDIPHSLGRRKLLLTGDVDTIRATNNAIFNDIFWVHLAYVTADDGIERLRALLQAERHYAPVLAGFEAIDQGRRVLADAMASAAARQAACDLIWQGNVELLRHEQRAVVQPNFDRLSCAFARLISIGSATSFEVRGVRREVASFTSFYLYSLSRESRTPCGHRRGRGSPASTTAGAGS